MRQTAMMIHWAPVSQLPEVELEIRADGDAEYRLVQEILQVASDSVDPSNGMKPKNLVTHQTSPWPNLL